MMGDKKKGAINAILGPDPKDEMDGEDGDDNTELHAIFSEIMDAIHSKDVPAGVEALKAFFTSCDSEPHEEGPSTDGE